MVPTFTTTPAAKPPQPQPLLPLRQDLQNLIKVAEPKLSELARRLIEERQPVAAHRVLGSGLEFVERLKETLKGL